MKSNVLYTIAALTHGLSLLVLILFLPKSSTAQHFPDTLRSVADIRNLSQEQANTGIPVEINGIITYCFNSGSNACFVQDDTDGIFIWSVVDPPVAGSRVIVRGVTTNTGYAPNIAHNATAEVLEVASHPEPSSRPPFLLMKGKEDSRWVEISGMVHSARIDSSHGFKGLVLQLATTNNDHVVIHVKTLQKPLDIVGSFIRVEGVAGGIFNVDYKLTGILIRTPDLDFIETLTPGVENPFQDLPLTQTSELFAFNFAPDEGHYVRVAGVVTYKSNNGRFAIVDATGSLMIQTRDNIAHTFAVGDSVVAVGFPHIGTVSPLLEDAIYINHGPTTHNLLPNTTSLDSLSSARDLDLLTVNATLEEVIPIEGSTLFILKAETYRFEAILHGASPNQVYTTR